MRLHTKAQPARANRGGVSRPRRRLALAVLAIVVVLAVIVVPALAAAGPPTFNPVGSSKSNKILEVYPTRVEIEAGGAKGNGAAITEERVELATGEGGPWTVAHTINSQTLNQSETSPGAYLGLGEVIDLSHLTPATLYYVRFYAANAVGSVTETLSFTTLPPAKPAVGELRASSVGTTFATLQAVAPGGRLRSDESLPAGIETNGSPTEYNFEYALPESGHEPAVSSPSWMPFTSGAAGTVTVAEEFANPTASLAGLAPETLYYARLKAKNAIGEATSGATNAKGEATTEATPFTTQPLHPSSVSVSGVKDAGGTSAFVDGHFIPHGSETEWHFEYALAESGHAPAATSPAWAVASGAKGTTTAAEAGENFSYVGPVKVSGLSPGSIYYVRLIAKNAYGTVNSEDTEFETDNKHVRTGPVRFETAGAPAASTFAVHTFAAGSEVSRVLGSVEPHTEQFNELQTVTVGGGATGGAFTLSFDGQTTAPIPFDASTGEVQDALVALSSIGEYTLKEEQQPNVVVEGNSGGPYTVDFGAIEGSPFAGRSFPQITADASGLTPAGAGTVSVAMLQQGGEAYDTNYHFEYVTQAHFEREGFAGATAAAEVDLGEGTGSTIVGEDLPALEPGVSYRYRLAATNTTPGDPVVHGGEQTLDAPAPAEAKEETCPNEALRTGASASLPDCRAYEQVTPAGKEGAQDIFTYPGDTEGSLVGQGGDRFLLHAPGVQWGSSPDTSASDYFFARTERGWQMTSPRPVGSASPDSYRPLLYTPDLAQIGLEARWLTSLASFSADVEFEFGPPGGPYTLIAAIPRSKVGPEALVGASADGGKVILSTEDRTLVPGHSTGTKSGEDLYEYSAGQLRQLNVTGPAPGTPVSTCGARLPKDDQGYEIGVVATAGRAVSKDGSRVFFEAEPVCGGPEHLYMRTDGEQTLDIGEYTFRGAAAEGTKLLLEKSSGNTHEFFLYGTEEQTPKLLFTTHEEHPELNISEELTDIYFFSKEQLTPEAPPIGSETGFEGRSNLYRYDLSAESGPQFIAQVGNNSGANYEGRFASPDGQYFYWIAAGIAGAHQNPEQVYRYDSAENVVQCMSCSSSFDPEPKRQATFLSTGELYPIDGVPDQTDASANGDYVFFDTTSALVKQDDDGEVEPIGATSTKEQNSNLYSVSSDVYEWRKPGVGGCAHAQGCLSLISSGRGGYDVQLLGTTWSGDDVFFATHESLVAQDQDDAGDVYDARVDGGFPGAAPRLTECEGAECSTPLAAPVDSTPASLAFSGAGNLLPAVTPAPKAKPKKTKAKKKVKKTGKQRKKRGRAQAKKGKTGKSARKRDDRQGR